MKKILRSAQPVLAIVISALVLLICVVGIVGVWIVQGMISSTAVQLLEAVDNTAQVLRGGITRVDTKMEALEEFTHALEDASAQISQNVNDKGLIQILLPETKEQELANVADSIRESIQNVLDYINTTKETIQAINSLPFVELPTDDLAVLESLQGRVEAMMTRVEELKTGISEFRSKASEGVSKITGAISELNSALAELRSGLARADAGLSQIQTKVRQLQELLPTLLILMAVLVTLLAIWVGYSQIVVIGRALVHLREIRNEEAAKKPDELEGPVQGEMESTPEEEAGSGDAPQT